MTLVTKILSAIFIASLLISLGFSKANAAEQIIFPIIGSGNYSNDFTSSRSNGQHNATDIFAEKGRQVVAAVSGNISYVAYPEPSWGYMITIQGDDGYKYEYVHLNNDNLGTDDGQGGGMLAYAPDIKTGNRVLAGQHIGYVGDSGNAESTAPHLHFEITDSSGNAVNPYDLLNNAIKIQTPVTYPQLPNENLPYGNFLGGLNLAYGNVTSASQGKEIITAAGKNGGPHIKVYDHQLIYNGQGFMAYDPRFTGGVDVATGDINGDQVNEIITSPGEGGGPNVKVFNSSGETLSSFMAYDPRFTGGVYVSAGDIDGDGNDEIITAPGKGGGPNVKVFEADGRQIGSFFVYDPRFLGGVDVSAGDISGDNRDEIVTAAGPSGGPHVRTWSYIGDATNGLEPLTDFFAYAPTFSGGVRVSVGNSITSSAKSEIVTVPYSNGGPQAKIFNSVGQQQRQTMYLEEWWYGQQDVVSGDGFVLTSNGLNRRATIRQAF